MATAFKRFAERKRTFARLEDSSSSSSSSDDDDDDRPAAKISRRWYDYGPTPVATVNTNTVAGTTVPVPSEANTPAVVRFVFRARDFPRLKSALVAAAAAWVGPVGGVHVSVDDAHDGRDVDDDIVMTVRAVDADTAVRAVEAVWRRYAGGRGRDARRRWTVDALLDSETVRRALRADTVWHAVNDWDTRGVRLATAATGRPRSVRVVRVCAAPEEMLRRIRRLVDLGATDPVVAAEAVAAATTVTPRPSPPATPGWAPSSPATSWSSCGARGRSPSSLPGVSRPNLSESDSSSDDERDENA